MAVPNELIAKFAKLSKESKIQRETTVFGTTVEYGGKLYVKMDGSDLLTPVATTSEISAGERVTVMVKDHTATVTGNISNPSASKGTTDAIEDEITTINATIGNFELVIADKVNTKELQAEVAKINELMALKANIVDLNVTNATIKDLNVQVANIDKALITKADIVDLDAANAEINTLKANYADIETLVGGNLTMDNIQSLVLTSSKVTVDNAFIKDAMIDRVSADKINAGTINTNNVNIQSEDGSMLLRGSLQQFKDAEGNVRIQIGKDASGDFTFALYGADGQGQLINQNGITASAIGDGLIVNSMVSDNANISGSKLDIDSVITEVNGSTTTIKSSKIYFDDKKQTLDVAFNTLNTTVDNTSSTVSSHTTSINTMQGQISTLISDTTIINDDGTTTSIKDAFSSMEQTVDGFSTKIGSLETTMDDGFKSVDSKISSVEQTLDGFSTRVTNTETKVNNLKAGSDNLIYYGRGNSDGGMFGDAKWTITNDYAEATLESTKTYSSIGIPNGFVLNAREYEVGAQYTWSYDFMITNWSMPAGANISEWWMGQRYTDSTSESSGGAWVDVTKHNLPIVGTDGVELNKWIHVTKTVTIPAQAHSSIGQEASIKFYQSNANVTASITFRIKNVSLTKGNIDVGFAPSSKEIQNEILLGDTIPTTDGSVVYIKDKFAETLTTVDGISNKVGSLEANFAEDGTVTNLVNQVSTLEQTASQFNMEFFQKVDNANQGVNEILSYITFDADGITIGQDSYPVRLMLTKDRIKFVDTNGAQLAYFSEGKLYVNNAEIINAIKIANYGFLPTANGSLTIGAIS